MRTPPVPFRPPSPRGGEGAGGGGPATLRPHPRVFSYRLSALPSYRPPMLARVRSAAVLGIDAYLVDVETDIANGLPTFATVGLPQGSREGGSRAGVRRAREHGLHVPLEADHREPRPGRHPQGRLRLRPADRGRDPRRHGTDLGGAAGAGGGGPWAGGRKGGTGAAAGGSRGGP